APAPPGRPLLCWGSVSRPPRRPGPRAPSRCPPRSPWTRPSRPPLFLSVSSSLPSLLSHGFLARADRYPVTSPVAPDTATCAPYRSPAHAASCPSDGARVANDARVVHERGLATRPSA